MLEYVILGLLMQKNQTGYQMKRYMMVSTSNFFNASFGSIYPALARLEKKGMITSMAEVEHGKYTKVYTIQEAGKASFIEWLQEPANVSDTSHNHLIKLFFYDYLDSQIKRLHYEVYIRQAMAAKQKLIDTIDLAKKTAGPDRMQTLTYGIAYHTNIIDFYTRLLADNHQV